MKGDIFFPSNFTPTPPLPIIPKSHHHDSPPSSPSSTPPSTPPYSSSSPSSSLSSSFSSPNSAFSSPTSQYLSTSAPPTHPSPFLSHSPPSTPSPTPPSTMATALFFPPPAMTSTPFASRRVDGTQDVEEDVEVEEVEVHHEPAIPRGPIHPHLHMEDDSDVEDDQRTGKNGDGNTDHREVHDEELEEDQDDLVVEDQDHVQEDVDIHDTDDGVVVAAGVAAVGLEIPRFLRRVTLKPRRTLSLSPTPARSGDLSMGRNLRAACWFDFTDKDDDDGLSRPADSDTDTPKCKTERDENGNHPSCIDKPSESVVNSSSLPSSGVTRRDQGVGSTRIGSLTTDANNGNDGGGGEGGGGGGGPTARLGVSSSMPALATLRRSSVKRPLEVTLPCQEIQYLDISYQKVQFSPIPRKKISYHPVLHHTIHYCEVSYCNNTQSAERPNKRKPLTRSHSFAMADLRDRVDAEFNYKFR